MSPRSTRKRVSRLLKDAHLQRYPATSPSRWRGKSRSLLVATPPLHSWKVTVPEAIQIQEVLKDRIILGKTFSEVRMIGGGDVAYSRNGDLLFGAIVVLSFPEMEAVDLATAHGKIPFPYIPGLFAFREGPIPIKAFQKLKMKPDLMIYDGQGIAHPKEFGLASHLGLWLDLPSIGCAKTSLLDEDISPGRSKGSFEITRKEGKEVGAVLRTREGVKPLFVSPGHRIDLRTSIQIVLAACQRFRIPEPLRRAHQAASLLRGQFERDSPPGLIKQT
jgi:deoxyribonuclease V